MSIAISEQNEQFLAQQVARGAYRDKTEALDAAVELLRIRELLRERWDEGRRQLAAGECVEFGDESLREFFTGLKQRASRRTSSASTPS